MGTILALCIDFRTNVMPPVWISTHTLTENLFKSFNINGLNSFPGRFPNLLRLP